MSELPTFTLSLSSQEAITHAYLPFIKHGGLLLKTNTILELGAHCLIELTLMEEPTPYSLTGEVIWLDENNINGDRIGVQLIGDNAETVHKQLLSYLA